jgi:Ca2+/Na+ antiporter
VKKIGKTKVFAVTTVFSVLAYVWMYIVLIDEEVKPYEAWITLALFPVLIGLALIADKMSDSAEKIDPAATLPVMNTLEFIEVLKNDQPEDQMAPGELQRKSTLKNFLKTEMGTDNINEVNLAVLKEKVEGGAVTKKGEYRKAFGSQLQGKKKFNDCLNVTILFICNCVYFVLGKRPKLAKGDAFTNEHNFASHLQKAMRHPTHGFHTLNFTVSEACK